MRTKLRALWWVLRGRSVIYRVHLETGPGVINFPMHHGPIFMAESTLTGSGPAATVLKAG